QKPRHKVGGSEPVYAKAPEPVARQREIEHDSGVRNRADHRRSDERALRLKHADKRIRRAGEYHERKHYPREAHGEPVGLKVEVSANQADQWVGEQYSDQRQYRAEQDYKGQKHRREAVGLL